MIVHKSSNIFYGINILIVYLLSYISSDQNRIQMETDFERILKQNFWKNLNLNFSML